MLLEYGGTMELGILIACGIISTLALFLSCVSIIMMVAKEKATHTVQLVPIDEEIDRANEEFLKKEKKSSWATSEEAIKKENKLYQEELEDEMPEFSLEDEDREIMSI
jgi:hypothetical protein